MRDMGVTVLFGYRDNLLSDYKYYLKVREGKGNQQICCMALQLDIEYRRNPAYDLRTV